MFYDSCFAFDYLVEWLDREGAQDGVGESRAWLFSGCCGFDTALGHCFTCGSPLDVRQVLEKKARVTYEEMPHVT
jgi:hypothetical protein